MKLRLLLLCCVALCVVGIAVGVSFTTGVVVNNNLLSYTDDDLSCTWSASGDTTALNVTWYRDGTKNLTLFDPTATNTSSTVPANDTNKNEVWTCRVRLENGTHNVTEEDNITIQNSAPSSPTIYDDGGQDIGNTQNGDIYGITEDVPTLFDANSSDLDQDTLLFYFKTAGICTITNSATGATTCTGVHSAIANASEDESPTLVNVTFWVDDDDPIFAASGSTKVTFNITPVNDEPTLTIANQTTNVTAVFNETFTASDEETDHPLSATLDLAGTDDEIEGDVAVTVENDTTVRIEYFTDPVDYNDAGNRTITLNLTDSRNASILTNFTLEIATINRPPYLLAVTPPTYNTTTNHTYLLNQGEHLSINVTVNDPDASTTPQTITFTDDADFFVINTTVAVASGAQNASGHINFTATNADVGTHTVTITFEDQLGATNTTQLNFTIQNRNDPPVLYNTSSSSTNTGGNTNLSSLVAYVGANFLFQINYTDPDLSYGDTVLFTENSTLYNISASGLINFTDAGPALNETVNITLTDAAGLQDTLLSRIELRPNTVPYFNESYPPLNCPEDALCQFNASSYARDDDDGIGSVTASGTLPTGFTMTDGYINFTPLQTALGSYTLTITIADTRGATAEQELNLTIPNTNDAPVWTRFNFTGSVLVEDKPFTYTLRGTDEDLLLNGTENLTFTTDSDFASLAYVTTVNDTIDTLLTLTPDAADIGSHRIQLNITDQNGSVNTTYTNVTVYADTDAPNVTHIRPYAAVNGSLVEAWSSTSALEENLSFSENTSNVLFAVNATDDDQAGPPYDWLNYTWYYDGAVVQAKSGTSTYTRSFDFFSSGAHNLTVAVNDTRLEMTEFSWLLTIQDVNRGPTLENDLEPENITGIDSTTTYTDYFVYNNGRNHFFDTDDDTNGNSLIDGNETVSLTYFATSCSVATLSAEGDSLKITPEEVGSCTVQFTATDPSGASATSNQVTIEVDEVPLGDDSTSTTTTSGGGGSSSSSSRSTFVPYETEVETPEPLTIIAPGTVTIYENETITIPFTLRNNWTENIEDIELSADVNRSGVESLFDRTFIDELPRGGTYEGELTLLGYRLGESFEVRINAEAASPAVSDSALVLFATIEQAEDADTRDNVNVKVTFARDLLSTNTECQELAPLLDEAEALRAAGDFRGANRELDRAINGCRYLISTLRERPQQPSVLAIGEFSFTANDLRTYGLAVAGIILFLGVLGIYSYRRTRERYDF